MGVNLKSIIPKKEIEISELNNKKIAIDAYNWIFQFLSIIRQRDTGEPLRDSQGRITSHLSGLFYRSIKLMSFGIKLIYVFDGKPPEFKKQVIAERQKTVEESIKKWKKAVKEGRKEDIMVYAQSTSKLTDEMIDESKRLLDAMGIPWVQAISEGEAEAAHLVKNKDAFAVGSQDMDSLLFGSPRLIRNLSITGKRKMPRQQVWVEIKPELIELETVLSELRITRQQLVLISMLVGTDYNPEGIEKIGPKTALKIVRENKTLDDILKAIEWKGENDPYKIYKFFMNPDVIKDYRIEWKEPDKDGLLELMVEEHDFSRERIERSVNELISLKNKESQSTLGTWFGTGR